LPSDAGNDEVVEESFYLFNPGGPGADAAIVRVRVDLN
jgi:hypothetical protein